MKFKKFIASALAAATLFALGSANVYAVEPSIYEEWETTYYNYVNAPVYTGTKDYCYIVYSFSGFNISCNGMQSTVSGASGKAYVAVRDQDLSMPIVTLTKQQTVFRKVTGDTGRVKGVHFEIYSSTDVANNTFTANGDIFSLK